MGAGLAEQALSYAPTINIRSCAAGHTRLDSEFKLGLFLSQTQGGAGVAGTKY